MKEHPRALIAAVHKDAGGDGWSSSDSFQSPPKPSGEVLDRATKVLWNTLRSSAVLIQSSFFLSNTEIKSMTVETGVSGDYATALDFDHRSQNLVLWLWLTIASTFLKANIFFRIVVGRAAMDEHRD